MAGNDSPDQDMERLLRHHFAEETPGLRAPSDTWARLENRLEDQQTKSSRSGVFRNILSPIWSGSGRLRLAGATVVLAALLAGAAVLITNTPDTGINEEASASRLAPSKMESGIAAAPVEGPDRQASPIAALPDPTEQRATPTVTLDGASAENTAEANPDPKSNSDAAITKPAKTPDVTEVVKEVASPVPPTPEGKTTTQETVVEREVVQTPGQSPAPAHPEAPIAAPAPTATADTSFAGPMAGAPLMEPAPTTLPPQRREESLAEGGAEESSAQSAEATPPARDIHRTAPSPALAAAVGAEGGFAPLPVDGHTSPASGGLRACQATESRRR